MPREENCRSHGKYSLSLTRTASAPLPRQCPSQSSGGPRGTLFLMLSGQHCVGLGEWNHCSFYFIFSCQGGSTWCRPLHRAVVGSQPASP